MLSQLIVASAASGTRRPGAARQIALAKPPQFHIKNNVTLKGYIGKDAQSFATRQQDTLVVLSLATKSSYKDKQSGEYVSHTEWHRCVVFGRLSEFAATLTKGAHVQVEGELRSREYVSKNGTGKSKKAETKQRIWEIRVSSILKLDRAEKSDEAQNEGEAA